MMEACKLLLSYVSYVEAEQSVRDTITKECKELERVTYALTMQIEGMISNIKDTTRFPSCADPTTVSSLLAAKDAYKRIQNVMPVNQFYRYNYLFRVHTQRIIQALAFFVYCNSDRLVTFEEAASLLGLRIAESLGETKAKTVSQSSSGDQSKDLEEQFMKLCGQASCAAVVSTIDADAAEASSAQPSSDPAAPAVVSPSHEGDNSTKAADSSTTETGDGGKSEAGGKTTEAEDSSTSEAEVSSKLEDSTTTVDRCCSPIIVLAADPSHAAPPAGDPSHAASPAGDLSHAPSPVKDSRPILTMMGVDTSLYLDIEDFLTGCLMAGSDLARLAVNSVTAGDYARPHQINAFLHDMHAGFTLLHYKNNHLRRTYDELKYSIKKTEDVVYNLSLRGLKGRAC